MAKQRLEDGRGGVGDHEIPGGIKRFSREAREALKRQEFIILDLTGKSIQTLGSVGRKFLLTSFKANPDFETLVSMRSQVAINPNSLFLPESNNKTLLQQEAMIAAFSVELGQTVPDVKAIIGEISDYTDLVFAYSDATTAQGSPDYLFGEKYGHNRARTKTRISNAGAVDIGEFSINNGLEIDCWDAVNGHENLFVAPIIIPA